MSVQVQSDIRSYAGTEWRFSRFGLGLLLLTTTAVSAADEYQHRMLFTPSESTLRAEAKGRVMIYDGLERKTVDRAMDEQFGRIDNMMFVRTRELQDDGEYDQDDDGCD